MHLCIQMYHIICNLLDGDILKVCTPTKLSGFIVNCLIAWIRANIKFKLFNVEIDIPNKY